MNEADDALRLKRLEDAVLALADLRDPSQREFPIVSGDYRARTQNAAERQLWEIAQAIRAERR